MGQSLVLVLLANLSSRHIFSSSTLMHALEKVKLVGCVRLCELMECSLPGSSVHGVFQARVLELACFKLVSLKLKQMDL